MLIVRLGRGGLDLHNRRDNLSRSLYFFLFFRKAYQLNFNIPIAILKTTIA